MVTKKKFFFRDPFLKKLLVENNSYIYVYDFPQKNFSMCHGTYSPIPDPSKNWSVKELLYEDIGTLIPNEKSTNEYKFPFFLNNNISSIYQMEHFLQGN